MIWVDFSALTLLIGQQEGHPAVNKSSAVAEMGDRLATVDMGRKVGEEYCAPFRWGLLGPHPTVSLGLRPTSIPSGILIHPAVWPQYTTLQADRTDRQDNSPIA